MTIHKKKRKESARSASNSIKSLFLPRARVLIGLAVVGGLGWGIHVLWKHVSPSVIHRDRYILSAERISISPLPEWIQSDLGAEVIRNAGLDRRLSVLDDAFVQVVNDAFVLHPWVESVNRITKSYPPGVHVELSFRRPVAVVEIAGLKGVQWIPIDRYGVHLPSSDVPDLLKRKMPRIGGIVERPPEGQQWADPRVFGAAELAGRLLNYWSSLHLVDILPSARPEIRLEHRYFVYDLITRGGTRIVWGAAPNSEPPGEDNFEAKLGRLRRYIDQQGPLDSVRGPAIVDVRHVLAITPRTVKNSPAANAEDSVIK